MKKILNKKIISLIIVLSMLLSLIAIIFAAEIVTEIKKDEVVTTDIYGAGKSLINNGTIKGDYITAGQEITSNGTVEGDIIAVAQTIEINGTTFGDVRIASQTAKIKGEIRKNVNIFAKDVFLEEKSQINGNVLICSSSLDVSGIIKGNSIIYCPDVILNGEIFGDVSIEGGESSSFEILPNTKIHGTLTYESTNKITIPPNAEVNKVNWIPLVISNNKDLKSDSPIKKNYLIDFIKIILTTLLYFLLGLIFYKFFPKDFKNQAINISKSPLSIILQGVLTLSFILLFIIVFIVLLVLSIFIISPSIALVLGTLVSSLYITLIYLSTIPVSLWLGNIIFKEKIGIIAKFCIGLYIITITKFLLNFASETYGIIIIITFIMNLGILLLGIGTIINSLIDTLKYIVENQKEEILIEEDIIQIKE